MESLICVRVTAAHTMREMDNRASHVYIIYLYTSLRMCIYNVVLSAKLARISLADDETVIRRVTVSSRVYTHRHPQTRSFVHVTTNERVSSPEAVRNDSQLRRIFLLPIEGEGKILYFL